MTAPAAPPSPAPGGERSAGDSLFEASAFERRIASGAPRRWMRWHRRALFLAALVGCVGLIALARWLAATPMLDLRLGVGSGGELVLRESPPPDLAEHTGRALRAIGRPGGVRVEVDTQLLLRSPRWQADDERRLRQRTQHEALAALLRDGGPLTLYFADGAEASVATEPRGYARLGVGFWPLAALAMLLYLFAGVLLLARPQPRTLLFTTMSLAQAGNAAFMAMASGAGIGLPPGVVAADLPWRVMLDLCTAAAALHLFVLHPRPLRWSLPLAAAGWALVPLWGGLYWAGVGPLWWLAQAACGAVSVAALAVASHSHRVEPDPYALVMRRLALLLLAALVLVTAVTAWASGQSAAGALVTVASTAWTLLGAFLLVLIPFLARSRQVMREFALLAGVSTVATSLDLLFVAVFSLGTFTSLAIAVFIGLGLYAGARQWMLNHLIGTSVLTTERTFDQLYRAAREVQAQPTRYAPLLTQLLRDLFEPLDMLRVDRVPVRSRIVGGGSSMVVPMRSADDDGHLPSLALVLRFAQRGRRLFTVDDARLADRVVDQLRRAVAYDRAVERGRAEERQRIAQDLHDDIGARLLTLMYQAPTPEMEDYIRHTLQDLKTLTRGLAAAEHRLSHAAAEWKSDLTQRLTAANVALDWSFSSDRDIRLSVVQWSALTRVLRELVSNALYHGHATRVAVAFHIEQTLLTLSVSDDGGGREPEAWAHGLGLGGVRKRVKVLGGEVQWLENGERGIVCQVRVPGFQGRG